MPATGHADFEQMEDLLKKGLFCFFEEAFFFTFYFLPKWISRNDFATVAVVLWKASLFVGGLGGSVSGFVGSSGRGGGRAGGCRAGSGVGCSWSTGRIWSNAFADLGLGGPECGGDRLEGGRGGHRGPQSGRLLFGNSQPFHGLLVGRGFLTWIRKNRHYWRFPISHKNRGKLSTRVG